MADEARAVVTQQGIMPITQALQTGLINLDSLSGAEFRQIKGKLKQVRDHVLYDSVRIKAAAAVPQGNITLFQIPQGQNTSLANDAALTYAKDASDTNLTGTGGQLSSGHAMVVQSIQVVLKVPSLEFTVQNTNVASINPTAILPAAVAAQQIPVSSATNQVLALTENINLRFRVDDSRDYENGTLDWFPAEIGQIGWAGGQQEGISMNGGMKARYLSRVRHLMSQQRFSVILEVTKNITCPISCRLKIGLVGTLYSPVG